VTGRGSAGFAERTRQQAAGGDQDLVGGDPARGDECRGSVLRVQQRRQPAEPPDHVEQVEGLGPAEREDGARLAALVGQAVVAPRQAIELVQGVHSEKVHPGAPLQDVRVHVDRVAGEIEDLLPAVGKTDPGAEALGTDRERADSGRDFFAGEGPIAADRHADRGAERSECQEEQTRQPADEHPLPATAARGAAGDQEEDQPRQRADPCCHERDMRHPR